MNIPQKYRAYAYRVLASAGVLAVFYGLLSSEELALWTGAVGTIFALPAKNTPTS